MMATTRSARLVLNKVPGVTICFGLIKVLSTTVGETATNELPGS
jgi:uncharacterized membrane-anchored protein